MDTNHGWEVCYQAALVELDDNKLRVKIDETRHAIDKCLMQARPDFGMKEHRDIANALEVLKALERGLDHRIAGPAA
jgi:hypothetical protein